jgi:glycine cleavage system H protein
MVAIFVALMFVSLVLVDLSLEKWRVWRAAQSARPALATGAAVGVKAFEIDLLCQLPAGVHLSAAHTWLKPDPAGGVEVGADALIAYACGPVRRIALPKVGDQVTAGQPLFRLEPNARGVTVASPITGRVLAVNSRLENRPKLLNSDPYGSGWICHLTPTRVAERTTNLRFVENAGSWLKDEFARFREFIFTRIPSDLALGATSQDGGLPASGCMGELDSAAWSAFEAEFLQRQ